MVANEGTQLRVALLQLQPAFGQKEVNKQHARELLQASAPWEQVIDVLLLPELALIGYMFQSFDTIQPLSDTPDGGDTRKFLASLCHQFNLRAAGCGFARQTYSGGVANSLIFADACANILALYDKCQLYDADKKWQCHEGDCFCSFILPFAPNIPIACCICMDINPYNFEAPWDDFELATFARNENAHLILMASAWCNAHPDDDPAVRNAPPNRWQTLEYWTSRLEPLLGSNAVFACADRIGAEGGVTFCGSSCFIQLSKQPQLLGTLSTTEEGLLVRDITLDAVKHEMPSSSTTSSHTS